MTDFTQAPRPRTRLRTTALILAAVASSVGLLLAGCSNSGPGAASNVARTPQRDVSHGLTPAGPAAAAQSAAGGSASSGSSDSSGSSSSSAASQSARLVLASQSIIYTASLTVQAANVAAAATRAASIVAAAGGYTASDQESIQPGHRQLASASLQLKIPVAGYATVLSQLSTALGTRIQLAQRATDVTQEVADVSSRVTSAQAAIAQLRALLRKAGSVGDLLSVQDQISAQESDLEALLAQQRTLAHATTYATVSLQLVSHHPAAVNRKKSGRGFTAGLAAGWRGLRRATSWLLTAVGAALPFVVIVAAAGAAGLGGRRRIRRRSRPSTAG